MNVTYRIRLFIGFVITWATRRVPHVEQDLLTLPEHLRSPLVFGGVRVAYSLVFYVVSCVLLFVCLSLSFSFLFIVSLFSIYEFDCLSGIFRPSSLPANNFVIAARPKRTIKAKTYSNCETDNIIERQVINNTRGLKVPNSNKPQYKHSFFVETTIHWNQLPDKVVHAGSVEAFKTALQEHRP